MRRGLDWSAPAAGVVGASVIAIGSIVTALAYTGSEGEAYNPLNHFVSELGEVRNSELAAVFNLSLIAGGIAFVVFMIGLGRSRRSSLARVAGFAGVIGGIGGAFVGVLPMDVSDQHATAALTFFNLGWIAVGLASIDFVRRPDPAFPRWLSVVGAVTVMFFIGFLVELQRNKTADGGLAAPATRPDLWLLTTLEWLVLLGILIWVFLTGVMWLRAQRERIRNAS